MSAMNRSKHQISAITRRDIADYLCSDGIHWAGRLEEPAFCVRVWPDLNQMPSTDSRYETAYDDIYQHTVRNYDWDTAWVFTDGRFNFMGGSDKTVLEFLAQTVHPMVRDPERAVDMVKELNRLLQPDGFQLVATSSTSGRPVYEALPVTSRHHAGTALKLEERTLLDDRSALQDHLDSISRNLSEDPAGAITACKDLVETACKLILDARAVSYSTRDDLPALYKKVAVELELDKASVPDSAPGSAAAHRILGSLSAAVFNLAELRNQLGRGHGRNTRSPACPRHARLAFNIAVTVTEFLFDTWQDRQTSADE